jgi:hypothetical protein
MKFTMTPLPRLVAIAHMAVAGKGAGKEAGRALFSGKRGKSGKKGKKGPGSHYF